MEQPIELRKTRDFGQIINDSFTFLKQNFKPLFKSLLIICGVFLLIGTATTVFQYTSTLGLFNGGFSTESNTYDLPNHTVTYFLSVFFNVFVLLLLELFIHTVTFCYISVYLQKGNVQPTFEEVWGYFRYYFFRVLGASIVLFILIIVGFVFCIIPGIYLSNVFYLTIPIIVMENASFGYAFNKSFRLIKSQWWFVFGIVFIMSLIVSITGSIANLPITGFTIAAKFFSQKSYTLPLVIFFSALKSLLMLAYVLPSIGMAFCYFNLSEEKEGLGLLSRIEKFGTNNNENPPMPTEEY